MQKAFKIKFLVFLIFICLLLAIRLFVFQIFIVSGNSMYPTIKNGGILLVSRFGFPVRIPYTKIPVQIGNFSVDKNDIIVFENDQKEILVKRLKGIPYDFYQIQEGKVISSPKEMTNSNIPDITQNIHISISQNTEFLSLLDSGRIPEKYYLLIGDNLEYSTDSRKFGLVPKTYLRGKVLWIF